MPTHVAAFAATILALAALPGPNNATITRQTLAGGRRAGWLTVAGTSSGVLIWASAAALGLSAIVLAAPTALLAIRLFGAGLLCVLGVLSLWSLRKPPAAEKVAVAAGRSYLVGVASSLSNAKAGVIAVSLVPQFVTAQGPVLLSSLGLGLLWACISGTWYTAYVWVIDRGRARVSRPSVRRALQAVTAVAMIGVGIAVAVGA
jgi:threonine/homoserine/homoserine lactone efflux protein